VKRLTFWQAVAVGLGNIVGAGIFVMAGSAISAAGPGALVAFGITAALATTVGLNSAELASKMPNVEGGVYSFARATLGDTVGFLVGWFRLISYAVSGAAVAVGFSGYLVGLGLPRIADFPIAILLIVSLSYLEVTGLRLAARVEQALVIINIAGLAVFIGAVLALGKVAPASFVPVFPHGAGGLLEAASIAFFAYSGFNTIATLTVDVEDGERMVPRAIILSLVASTLLYVLVVFSMLVALNWSNYGSSPAPLSLALSSVQAPAPVSLLVGASALTATFTVTLSLIIAGSRTTKQMGEDDLLPRILGKGSRIPTMLVAGVMIASLTLGDVRSIALVANFGVIFSYMLSGLEVIVARRSGLRSKFSSPGYPSVQIFSLLLSAIMLATLGIQSLVLGTVTLVAGLVVHLIQQLKLVDKTTLRGHEVSRLASGDQRRAIG
jgi:APA family basic amino acid/polyamine antiporter